MNLKGEERMSTTVTRTAAIAALSLWLGLPLAAWSQTPAADGFNSSSATYRCAGGQRLQVVYLNINNGPSFATLQHRGRLVLMKTLPTGSGATYGAVDEALGYVWRTKGVEGHLYQRMPGGTGEEKVLLRDCRER